MNGSGNWYMRRNELQAGMVFNTWQGVVKLDRTVPGHRTRWYVATLVNGSWAHYDNTIDPIELLGDPLPESPVDPEFSEGMRP